MHYHMHLKNIRNDDNISYKLNNEIIMIPSSPNITYREQKLVYNIVLKYILELFDEYFPLNILNL